MFSYNHRVWGVDTAYKALWNWGAVKTRFLCKHLDPIEGPLLEVGCGGGQFLRALRKYKPKSKLWGIDISTTSITYAKGFDADINYKRASAYKLPFKDNSFQGVFLIDVLEHIKDTKKVLSEVHRVLVPGGVFISATPLERSIFTLTGLMDRVASYHPKEVQLGHVVRFTRSSLVKAFTDAGFEITSTSYSTHYLSQIVDLGVSGLRRFSTKKDNFTVGGFVQDQPAIVRSIFTFATRCIVLVLNFESLILSRVPGLTLMIAARRS